MPTNCPIALPALTACLGCRNKHGKECWNDPLTPQQLSAILTVEEKVAMLEDKLEPSIEKPPETEWSVTQWDYVRQLKGQVVFLTNKVNELLARKPKRKSKYLYQ